jgi:hypothetical protein
MRGAAASVRGLWGRAGDARGQVTLEWAMVLAFIALPMYFVLRLCMALLIVHFQMVSFLETIPFP